MDSRGWDIIRSKGVVERGTKIYGEDESAIPY